MNDLTWMNWNKRMETDELSKVVRDPHVFSRFLYQLVDDYFVDIWIWAHAIQSRAHFVDHFPRSRRPPAETETRQRRPRTATLPKKKVGFRARECFQSWIHAFPIAHTSQLLDDNVVDMMMWLTRWFRWWCGWHDGETAIAMTIVPHSQVSELNFLWSLVLESQFDNACNGHFSWCQHAKFWILLWLGLEKYRAILLSEQASKDV